MYGKAALKALTRLLNTSHVSKRCVIVLTLLVNTSHVWKSRVTGTDVAF
jgi:hypothetical protein